MTTRKRASRRVVLATWLSLFTLLMATFSWLPAAAQDATPEGEGTETQSTTLQETSDTTGESKTTGEGDPGTGDEPSFTTSSITTTATMTLGTVSVDACGTVPGSITGTVSVTAPATDAVVEIKLVDVNGTALNILPVTVSSDGVSLSIPFEIALANVSITGQTDVGVAAIYGGVTVTSSPLFPIHIDANGAVACGPAPVTSDVTTATSTATSTATETATSTATSTATATATETATATTSAPETRSTETATSTATATTTPTTAPTVSYATVVNTGIGLRCRAAPVNGAVLDVLRDGTRVEVRGATENGWTPVKCGGSDSAWMAASYLRIESGTTPDTSDDGNDSGGSQGTATVVNTGGLGLRCRTAPVNGSIITVMAEGATVDVRGATQNGWVPLTCANRDGWSSALYLRLSSGGTTTPPDDSGDSDGDGSNGTATVVNTGGLGLRCRTAPGGSIITVMAEGLSVPLRGSPSGGWAPVECANRDGYASTTYLRINTGGTTPPPTNTPDDGDLGGTGKYGTVVQTGGLGLRCRTAPVDGSIITVLAESTRVETRGATTNGWVPVICANRKGWVSKAYFALEGETTPPPTSGGGKMVTVAGTGYSGLRCRTAPVDGAVIGVIPEGGRVETRGATTNGWIPVTCFGQAGWISATYVYTDTGSSGGSGEFWIDVNLSTQYMRVYRGNTVINGTYVSTGRPRFATPPGTFYIIRKLPSQTMSGVLGGEYYYVPNVPWVMYFTNRGHAIHGAYWHNNFGTVMSHGCVNLPVGFAQWLYYNTPMYTRVRIHY